MTPPAGLCSFQEFLLGKTMPESGGTVMIWILWGFLLGIVAVWLYAAVRPRYREESA